jgi:hypothetical protein
LDGATSPRPVLLPGTAIDGVRITKCIAGQTYTTVGSLVLVQPIGYGEEITVGYGYAFTADVGFALNRGQATRETLSRRI